MEKLIQEELLFETSKSEKERDSLPIDMRVKNVVRYLLSYGFEVHNIVHCDFDEEGAMAVLVNDKDNGLSTLCPNVLGLYSDVYVYDIEDTDENSIVEVFGDARDFLALPNPLLTEKEKEEAVWKILNQIEATCFNDYNEAYRSVLEKTIMDKDGFVEVLEKKIKHYTDVLQSKKKSFSNLNNNLFEVYLKGATQSLESVTTSSSKFFVVVKTMDVDSQWSYYLEKPLHGNSLCDAFQEFLDLYMSGTREYGLYKNYNLKEFSLDYFYEV